MFQGGFRVGGEWPWVQRTDARAAAPGLRPRRAGREERGVGRLLRLGNEAGVSGL
jgi:hypothetical protein